MNIQTARFYINFVLTGIILTHTNFVLACQSTGCFLITTRGKPVRTSTQSSHWDPETLLLEI